MAEGVRWARERATLEVRRSNEAARRCTSASASRWPGSGAGYYTNPSEDALVLWREQI